MQHKKLYCCFIIYIFLLSSVISVNAATSKNNTAVVQSVKYESSSGGILLELSKKTACETIRVDNNQILIAIKHGSISEALPDFKDDQIIKTISTDNLPGNVMALVINTRNSVDTVSPSWLSDGKTLLVKFDTTIR